MFMCICKGITESHVESLAQSGVTSPEDLIASLGLHDDRCCGRCAREIDRFVVHATSAGGMLDSRASAIAVA